MQTRTIRVPGPGHPISIEKHAARRVVKIAGQVIADSRDALTLREANYPAVYYFPRSDVVMKLLVRTQTSTYCPYKGDCSYFNIVLSDARYTDAVWSYETPFDPVAQIKDHLAFYGERIDGLSIGES